MTVIDTFARMRAYRDIRLTRNIIIVEALQHKIPVERIAATMGVGVGTVREVRRNWIAGNIGKPPRVP